MRIVQAHDEPWDSGIAHYALTLARGLADRGHAVQFWARKGSFAAQRARAMGLVTREIAQGPAELPVLRRALRRKRVQLINAHTGQAQTMTLGLAAGTGIKVVRTCADARMPRAYILSRLLARRTAAFIAANGAIERHLRASFPKSRVELVLPGIPQPGPEVPPLPANQALGLLGRFDPVKGHEDLIEAVALLRARGVEAVLRFAGKGELEPEMATAAARRLEPMIAEFHGHVPDIARFIAGCRVGVVPSRGSEAVSRAALEWMAMGRPVVATKVGGLSDVVADGETGFLVPPESPEALARALERLLAEPATCAAMGEAARRRWQAEFTVERLAARTEKVYETLV